MILKNHDMRVLGKVSRSITVGMVGCAMLATLGTTPTYATSQGQQPVQLSLGSLSGFKTLDGKKLATVSDDSQVGERKIRMKDDNGNDYSIVVQSAPPTSDSPQTTNAPLKPDLLSKTSPAPVTQKLTEKQLQFDTSKMEPVSAYGVSANTVSLTWKKVSQVSNYEIYRNDMLTLKTTKRVFNDTGLVPGSTYYYKVVAAQAEGAASQTLTSEKTFAITTLVSSVFAAKEANALATTQYSNAYVYRTFIPDNLVSAAACNWGDNSYQFRGDNRGYRAPRANAPYQTPDYRTQMWANVNWANPDGYKLVLVKGVGQSITYKNGKVVSASYADSCNMRFEEGQSAGAYAQVRFNHSASNPHCKLFNINYGGAIRYNVMVRFYRSGVIEVVGWRQGAPAHEGWARFQLNNGFDNWKTNFQLPNRGFECLIEGVCGIEKINARSQA